MAQLECPVPESVSHEQRAKIRGAFEDTVARLGPKDEHYVQQRLPRVIARLLAHGGWLRQLSAVAKALSVAYFAEADPVQRLADDGRRHILAALYYLCDPYDVIPDFDSSGYLDDAVVVNRCLSLLRNRWSALYELVVEAA